ncbi:MAG TPA: hypothetical protein VEI54_06860 [Candidatus Limnocylindrales bacterium]|nr:hypothetical protein [Candidatus Limnocylindrales bacterium]
MTIVIGIMANTIQPSDAAVPASCHLLLCADAMATHANLQGVPITSHPAQGKIYPLPHGFYAAFCDTYYKSHEIATELTSRMLGLDFSSDGIKDLIKLEVRKSFDYAFSWYREAVLRTQVGITVDQYLYGKKNKKNKKRLRPSLIKRANEALKGGTGLVPAEFIIAGQTHRGPLLLKANGYDLEETTEFHVSGGPSDSAISWLKFREQRNSMSVARSLYHMVEAKRFCQTDPTVSRTTQIVWIPPTGNPRRFQDDGVTTLNDLTKKFGLIPTDELDSEEIRIKFEQEAERCAIP